MAEAALDHPAVEELERILRPEPERLLRVAERLVATAVPRERPGEDVVAVDRRPLGVADPGQRERVLQADPVVDVEERDLEIDADAVGAQQLLDRADQLVLAPCGGAVARRGEQVAEGADVLREGIRFDRLPLVGDRELRVPERRLGGRERVQPVGVVGEDPVRASGTAAAPPRCGRG